jgi:hypothetical protein
VPDRLLAGGVVVVEPGGVLERNEAVQRILVEKEGSVRLTSLLMKLVLNKV